MVDTRPTSTVDASILEWGLQLTEKAKEWAGSLFEEIKEAEKQAENSELKSTKHKKQKKKKKSSKPSTDSVQSVARKMSSLTLYPLPAKNNNTQKPKPPGSNPGISTFFNRSMGSRNNS